MDKFNRIPPFKWFVLQNFPFIEEDFDAITNYELLCKIVEYLNLNIEKTNALGEQVEALTNWFNNLDVQDEINNKLDVMAEDGTLAEIINEEIFGELSHQVEQNTGDIEQLQNTIPTLAPDLTELVIFGDSWTASSVTDAIWPSILASNLNLNLHNYAVNGAGFVSPVTNLFSSQVTIFANDDNVNKEKVKYIVLLGGINDYRNSVAFDVLGNAISNSITQLKTLCPQAKILFVSNCQYPRTVSQSYYWILLHDYLSTAQGIATLNLDDVIDFALYNTANYFHLTQNGQKFMQQKILCALTGGEITPFRALRIVEDDYIRIASRVQKQGNFAFISYIIYIKQSFQSHELDLESGVPDFPYPDNDKVYSGLMQGQFPFDWRVYARKFVIACDVGETFTAQKTAYINLILPLTS